MHMTFHQSLRRMLIHHDMIQATPIAPEAIRSFGSMRANGMLRNIYNAMIG